MSEVNAGNLINVAGTSGIAVASTAVVYSNSFPLPEAAYFSVGILCDSAGTVDVKVELEQGFVRPTTEGAASTLQYAIPVNTSGTSVGVVSASIADEILHVVNFAPVPTPFARFKLTGGATNAASTVVTKLYVYYVKD